MHKTVKTQTFNINSNVQTVNINDKRKILTGNDDSTISIWDFDRPNPIKTLQCQSAITKAKFSPLGKQAYVGTQDGILMHWDLEKGKVLGTFEGHTDGITDIAVFPDHKHQFIATGSTDTFINMWDIRRKTSIKRLKGHRSAVSCLKFSPDNQWLISGGLDGAIKLWDLNKTGKFDTLTSQTAIEDLIVNPQSCTVSSLHNNKNIMTWDLGTFESVSRIKVRELGKLALEPVMGRHLFTVYGSSFDVYDIETTSVIDSGNTEWTGVSELHLDETAELLYVL